MLGKTFKVFFFLEDIVERQKLVDFVKDTHRENKPSINIKALTKSMNMSTQEIRSPSVLKILSNVF